MPASDDILEDCLTRFLEAWESAVEPPRLEAFLPPSDASCRPEAAIELTKIDLEFRLARGETLRLEDYLERLPELRRGNRVACELIYEEFRLRREAGEPAAIQEYLERFPGEAEGLRVLMNLTPDQFSTIQSTGCRLESIQVGEQLDDFDLILQLGAGSFARVFLARQRSMQRLVALKVSADRGNEPQTLAQLDHPHIIRVFDQRRLPERQMRLLYMEFAPGGTLKDVADRARRHPPTERNGQLILDVVRTSLKRTGVDSLVPVVAGAAVSWPQAVCRIGAKLAGALHYAHSHGVQHRDIKPANVLLTASGEPKLADFNISFCSEVAGDTPAAYLGGSLAYMSPEQLRAFSPQHDVRPEELDGRADLYSLAVLLWELLHGERPYQNVASPDLNQAIEQMLAQRRRVPRPHSGGDPISAALQDELIRCLHPEPAQRPQSSRQLASALSVCLHPHARRLLRPPRSRIVQWAARHPLWLILTALVVPNLIAAVVNWLYNYNWVDKQGSLPLRSTFFLVQAVINLIAFPVGAFIVIRWLLPGVRALRRRQAGETLSAAEAARARRGLLNVGHFGAAAGIALWSLAAVAYPLCLHLAHGPAAIGAYPVFLVSLPVCGLVAAAYPFFGATWLSMRLYYGQLLTLSETPDDEPEFLSRLAQSALRYLLLAAGVPILLVLILTVQIASGASAKDEYLMAGLAFAGTAGLFLSFAAHRTLERDLSALAQALQEQS